MPERSDDPVRSQAAGARATRATRAARVTGPLALIVLTASFAVVTVLARYLNSGFTIEQQVYLRAGIACLIGCAAFGRRIQWRVVACIGPREGGVVLVRAVLLYPIGTTLFSRAATLTNIGDVSFIAALPLVAAIGLVAPLMLRRGKPTARKLGCVAVSALGAAVLCLGSAGTQAHSGSGSGSGLGAGSGSGSSAGDVLALLAMVAIAFSYVTRSWHGGGLTNPEITVLTLAVGALCVALMSVVEGQGLPHVGSAPVHLWSAAAAAGVLNVLNVYLLNYGFEHVDAVRAGNLLTIESVWGLALGAIVYGQHPTPRELFGGALIVASAIALNSAPSSAVLVPAGSPAGTSTALDEDL